MGIVAVDIDSTLYDFFSEVREKFFELSVQRKDKGLLRGAYVNNFEWRELTDLGQDIALEVISLVHSEQFSQIPYKGAVEVLNDIAEKHSIRYVGARKDEYWAITQSWLWYCGFPDGELICSRHDKTQHLEDCQYLIDDRPMTVVNFVYDPSWSGQGAFERKAFGLWTPYNRNLTDLRNIYLAPTWRGIEFYMKRKGIL